MIFNMNLEFEYTWMTGRSSGADTADAANNVNKKRRGNQVVVAAAVTASDG